MGSQREKGGNEGSDGQITGKESMLAKTTFYKKGKGGRRTIRKVRASDYLEKKGRLRNEIK